MKTLTMKQIALYLPYDVSMRYNDIGAEYILTVGSIIKYDISKPILKPLSDYKDINSKAMCNLNCDITDQILIADLANKLESIDSIPYGLIKLMAANHIDFQNLIPENLAIDFNTLKQ